MLWWNTYYWRQLLLQVVLVAACASFWTRGTRPTLLVHYFIHISQHTPFTIFFKHGTAQLKTLFRCTKIAWNHFHCDFTLLLMQWSMQTSNNPMHYTNGYTTDQNVHQPNNRTALRRLHSQPTRPTHCALKETTNWRAIYRYRYENLVRFYEWGSVQWQPSLTCLEWKGKV
jgi:hypothetical protein